MENCASLPFDILTLFFSSLVNVPRFSLFKVAKKSTSLLSNLSCWNFKRAFSPNISASSSWSVTSADGATPDVKLIKSTSSNGLTNIASMVSFTFLTSFWSRFIRAGLRSGCLEFLDIERNSCMCFLTSALYAAVSTHL